MLMISLSLVHVHQTCMACVSLFIAQIWYVCILYIFIFILLINCPFVFLPQSPDELFEVLSQSLLAAVDRDALSGWGAVVHIM